MFHNWLTFFLFLQDSGAYLEHRYTGPRSVSILGLSSGVLDLTESSKWGNKV